MYIRVCRFLFNKLHNNENPIYVFLSWILRGLSPNFHIHVFVIDPYIPTIGPPIFLKQNWQTNRGNIQIPHRNMNVGVGGREVPFWEYLFRIFGIVSLQCAGP